MCLWDMRGKMAEMRWQSAQPLRSISWHYEGKHFASSHTDGSLCTWPLRPTPMPLYHNYPHGELLLLWCVLCRRRRRNPDDDASLSRLLGLNYYVINRHFVGTLINNLNTPFLSPACLWFLSTTVQRKPTRRANWSRASRSTRLTWKRPERPARRWQYSPAACPWSGAASRRALPWCRASRPPSSKWSIPSWTLSQYVKILGLVVSCYD